MNTFADRPAPASALLDAASALLDATSPLGPDRLGGKACALARLGAAFTIPPWLVVPPDFPDAALDADLTQRVCERLGPGPWAVRSSAADEDQAGHAFAGQFLSFLNVAPDELPARVRAVRASANSESVHAYRRQRGLPDAAPTPAVLIQTMVAADAAGIAFSVDPLDVFGARVVVNAVAGLGDRLAGGEVSGDSYHLPRPDHPDAVAAETLIDARPVLDAAQRQAVADLALAAEAHFGCPQDIEWAYAGDTLHLLQSRPITTLETGEAVLWDNANIVESYSGLTSPLTFSFARHVYAGVYRAFGRQLGVPAARIQAQDQAFDTMLGLIDGHVYYNLLNWYRTLALLPGFSHNRRFMEQMMGVGSALPRELADRLVAELDPPARHWRDALAARLGPVRIALRLLREARRLRRSIAAFEAQLDRVLAAPAPPLAARDLPRLARRYRALEAQMNVWDAPILNDFLCMIAFGASQALLRRWLGDAAGRALHNDFMIGQGDIVSAEPARRVHAMAALVRDDPERIAALLAGAPDAASAPPAFAAAFADYLAVFGDRCTQELKLESLTLSDDPVPLLQAVGHATAHRARAAAPLPDPDAALAAALCGWKLALARRVVGWAKGRVRDRENLRFQRTRLFGQVRRTFLLIGEGLTARGALDHARDVFWLEKGELLSVIEGTATCVRLRELVALRREQYAGFAAAAPPPKRFWTRGAAGLARQLIADDAPGDAADGDTRHGLGCCRGVLRGRVRVIDDPRRDSLKAGEILVARHTDPGWIALFASAAGIVVERGSLLSHSAIVAREMGIPAVVGVPGLLDWLRTGDEIELDGASGRVVKLPSDDAA